MVTTDVEAAARVIREGGLAAFATETVYGLGADALNVSAVAQVFAAKERPHLDPLIVHIADASEISTVAKSVSGLARRLMTRFWPGPLTLVLPKQDHIPDLVTSGLPTVAVRAPDHEQARTLIRLCGRPLAAPSANPFGRISPTTAEHVREGLGDRIDLILDGGPCRVGVESTVLLIRGDDPPLLLRAGGVTVEEIEAEIGPVALKVDTEQDREGLPAPGMLLHHYAPTTPLVVAGRWEDIPHAHETGALAFEPSPELGRFQLVEVLSTTGSLTEAAAGFFAALRRLDASGVRQIAALRFPETGLGRALNDRLTKASYRS